MGPCVWPDTWDLLSLRLKLVTTEFESLLLSLFELQRDIPKGQRGYCFLMKEESHDRFKEVTIILSSVRKSFTLILEPLALVWVWVRKTGRDPTGTPHLYQGLCRMFSVSSGLRTWALSPSSWVCSSISSQLTCLSLDIWARWFWGCPGHNRPLAVSLTGLDNINPFLDALCLPCDIHHGCCFLSLFLHLGHGGGQAHESSTIHFTQMHI